MNKVPIQKTPIKEAYMNNLIIISIMQSLFISFTAAQPVEFSGQPVLKTSFQENLWSDLWNDDFVGGVDFLLSVESQDQTTHILHRMEWDEANSHIDGSPVAGIIENLQFFNMDWQEFSSTSVSVEMENESDWNATILISTSGFAGTIESDGGYSPHIYGIVKTITIVEDANSGGLEYIYNCWMPSGRAITYDAAVLAAEDFSEEITRPPSLTLEPEDCRALYNLWAQTNYDNYKDRMDGCGGVNGAVSGAGAAGTVGGSLGFIFGGPGVGAVSGFISSVAGGVGGFIYGVTNCVDDTKRIYRIQYRNNWACYQACRITGDWDCGP